MEHDEIKQSSNIKPMDYKTMGYMLDQLGMLYNTLDAEITHKQDFRSTTSFTKTVHRIVPNNAFSQLMHTFHSSLRSAGNRIYMHFTKEGGAFRSQLAAIDFEYPDTEVKRSNALVFLQEHLATLEQDDPSKYTPLISAFENLPSKPNLENIWDFISAYRAAYTALHSRHHDPHASTLELFDESFVKPVCTAFYQQLLELDEIHLDITHPLEGENSIPLTLRSKDICYPACVLASSGGKGMLNRHQPYSIQEILRHNGTTTDIVDSWNGLQNAILKALKETHPEVVSNPNELLRCNQLMPGEAQSAQIRREIENALPEIIELRNNKLSNGRKSTDWGLWPEDTTIGNLAKLAGYDLSDIKSVSNAASVSR